MKKIFYLALLVLVLSFALAPIDFVLAQSGTCVDANGNRINLAFTPSQCQSLGGTWVSSNPPPAPTPTPTSSQTGAFCSMVANPDFQDLVRKVTCIINNSIIPLIFSAAVAIFIYGVVQYVINDGNETKKDHGRQFMVWGIIALTVMISVWGLVQIATNTFGINFVVPQLQTTP